jgi:hypothetical protein
LNLIAGTKLSFPSVEPPRNVSLEDVFRKKNIPSTTPVWNDPQFKNFVNQTPQCTPYLILSSHIIQAVQLPGPNGKPYPITVNTKLPNGQPQYWNQKYLPFPTDPKTESSPAKIMSNIYPPTKPMDKNPMTIEQLKLLQQQQMIKMQSSQGNSLYNTLN